MIFVISLFVLSVAICLGLSAGTIWLLCWGLNAIGIHSICGWSVHFSWPLVLVFTIVYMILKSIFKNTTENEN